MYEYALSTTATPRLGPGMATWTATDRYTYIFGPVAITSPNSLTVEREEGSPVEQLSLSLPPPPFTTSPTGKIPPPLFAPLPRKYCECPIMTVHLLALHTRVRGLDARRPSCSPDRRIVHMLTCTALPPATRWRSYLGRRWRRGPGLGRGERRGNSPGAPGSQPVCW